MGINISDPSTSIVIFLMMMFYFISMVVLSYYLGKRKTQTPKICAAVGLGLAFAPPFSFVYLAVLLLKADINKMQEN